MQDAFSPSAVKCSAPRGLSAVTSRTQQHYSFNCKGKPECEVSDKWNQGGMLGAESFYLVEDCAPRMQFRDALKALVGCKAASLHNTINQSLLLSLIKFKADENSSFAKVRKV
jgi:hypothetical protein